MHSEERDMVNDYLGYINCGQWRETVFSVTNSALVETYPTPNAIPQPLLRSSMPGLCGESRNLGGLCALKQIRPKVPRTLTHRNPSLEHRDRNTTRREGQAQRQEATERNARQ